MRTLAIGQRTAVVRKPGQYEHVDRKRISRRRRTNFTGRVGTGRNGRTDQSRMLGR